MNRPDHAREIRNSLTDVRALCERLGLLARRGSFSRQARGMMICCPVHDERTPSCSVLIAKDGTIGWKCHGACGAGGDALTLIGAVRGLDMRRDFRAVLREGAEIAGLWSIVAELDSGRTDEARPRVDPPKPSLEPDRDYPAAEEVERFWSESSPTGDDSEVCDWLRGRAIDPDAVDARDLARAIAWAYLPRFARYRGQAWSETGHRAIVRMYDAAGSVRSVRACRVRGGESPKRLPPSGHKAAGLVMADPFGAAMLAGQRTPERVIVVEGEPDFLTWASRLNDPRAAVLGIVSGSWSATFAARIPLAADVIIRTDHDATGDSYANEIATSLRHRCFVKRSRPVFATSAAEDA